MTVQEEPTTDAAGYTPPTVSFVVVAFHRPRELEALLRALSDPAIEVIVVNAENDPEVAEASRRTKASVVALSDNPGYAAAVNAGVAVARAPVTIFSNDDVVISAATALGLAGAVTHDGVDVAVPLVRNEAGEREPTIAALPTVRALALEWMLLPDKPFTRAGQQRVQKWRSPTVPERIDAASATIVAVRTELLRSEPLPEEYFLYWEEFEWFWRLARARATVQFRPELSATHVGGRADVRADKSRLVARNAVRCVRRTGGRAAAAAALPIVVLWQLRLVVTALLRDRSLVRARLAGVVAAAGAWKEIR